MALGHWGIGHWGAGALGALGRWGTEGSSTRALGHWGTGALVHWGTGALKHWALGQREHWGTGALGQRTGALRRALGNWGTGTLGRWEGGRVNTGALGHWNTGGLGHWGGGGGQHWDTGASESVPSHEQIPGRMRNVLQLGCVVPLWTRRRTCTVGPEQRERWELEAVALDARRALVQSLVFPMSALAFMERPAPLSSLQHVPGTAMPTIDAQRRTERNFRKRVAGRGRAQRRVDLPTLRLFDTREWRREQAASVRAALLNECPCLRPSLHRWFSDVATRAPRLTVKTATELLSSECGVQLCTEEPVQMAVALEVVVEVADVFHVDTSPVLTVVRKLWNAQTGVYFACEALVDCTCEDIDDARQTGRRFELSAYRNALACRHSSGGGGRYRVEVPVCEGLGHCGEAEQRSYGRRSSMPRMCRSV